MYSTMADPDLELRREGGGGQFCFASLASFSSYSDFFFLTKIRGVQVCHFSIQSNLITLRANSYSDLSTTDRIFCFTQILIYTVKHSVFFRFLQIYHLSKTVSQFCPRHQLWLLPRVSTVSLHG